MRKIDFSSDWGCYPYNNKEHIFSVTLPHDAMLLDKRTKNSISGVNTGWYEANDYVYEKTFSVPEQFEKQEVGLEFEGIYGRSEIYINGILTKSHNNGYSSVWINITSYLNQGVDNVITIKVFNSQQPNSRWYTGTGIYRPAWLWIFPSKHIEKSGIRVTTLESESPKIKVEVKTNAEGIGKLEILNNQTVLYSRGIEIIHGNAEYIIELPDATIWDIESPTLYRCRIVFQEDSQEVSFGIRTINCSSVQGFCLNGKRVVLRGACIHHDNGLLGACAYDFAEERKIRILKEAGFNAIRSAHNPCSDSLLDACDKLGMLVMDEYTDCWYIHKTMYDYASLLENYYEQDLEDMVAKDFNHPSVIMYSIGNEVAESAQEKGIDLSEKMTSFLHRADSTRPVTCGINIFFNFLSSLGLGVYSDKKAKKSMADNQKKRAVGSEFYNNLAGIFGSNFMKIGATLPPCDNKTKGVFETLDVAGYNYGVLRYKKDVKKYPDRIIVGSETFCSDSWYFWEFAKKNPSVIGDFVWAGFDYLGEVGIGAWEYKEYAPDFSHGVGWLTAGAGRIDLTGKPLAEMAYMRVAYELDTLRMAVVPVKYASEKHSPSAWKMSNAMESWSWNGCDGSETIVEVYSRAKKIKLFLNDICVGTKVIKKDCKTFFKVCYESGILKAVAYDAEDQVIEECLLKTAGKETKLTIIAEKEIVKKNGELCYLRLQYTDNAGILKPLEHSDISISVKGGRLLGLGNACPYNERGFLTDITDTYYGEAQAIIKPDEIGTLRVDAECKYGTCSVSIDIV